MVRELHPDPTLHNCRLHQLLELPLRGPITHRGLVVADDGEVQGRRHHDAGRGKANNGTILSREAPQRETTIRPGITHQGPLCNKPCSHRKRRGGGRLLQWPLWNPQIHQRDDPLRVGRQFRDPVSGPMRLALPQAHFRPTDAAVSCT